MRRIKEMVKGGTKYLSVVVRFDELREDSLLTEYDEFRAIFNATCSRPF